MVIKLSHMLLLNGISILIVLLIILGINIKVIVDWYNIHSIITNNSLNYHSTLPVGVSPLESCNLYRPSKYVYRLGDMIGMISEREKAGGIKYHLKNFPNSIVSEYITNTQDANNYDILKDIVKRRSLVIDDIPTKNTCVIHLRVGDVINSLHESVSEIVRQPARDFLKRHYTLCFDELKKGVEKIPPVNNIVLVAGMHNDCPTAKSCDYVATIKHMLEKDGYSVTTRLGGDADDDFVFMCMAPSFIASGGQYSDRIANTRVALQSGPTVNGKCEIL